MVWKNSQERGILVKSRGEIEYRERGGERAERRKRKRRERTRREKKDKEER
jgi:hypothetical protein